MGLKFAQTVAASAFIALVAATAGAQTLDHLQCYKSRDPLHVDAVTVLDSAQFGLEPGCKIGRTALVCVPATSTMQGNVGALAPIEGQPLEDARICYKVKCSSPSAPDVELGDMFGTRVFSGLKTSLLCTPASGQAPGAASTTTTTTAATAGLFQNIGTYGVPVGSYPNYQERATNVLVNAVRMAPLDYRAKYTTDNKLSLAAVGALSGYPAVEPVYWVLGLNQAARYHSQDMLQNNCFKHSSCDGTSWTTRVLSFYSSGAGGENIAAGMSDPRALVNAWLCDSTGTACCKDFASCDGHRRNIMTDRFRASGVGYYTSGTRHYWTQDLAGALTPIPPPTPLVDGSHVLIGTTNTTFLANYRDANGAPRSVSLVLGGVARAMALNLGVARKGTFAAVVPRGTACRSYHFEAVDWAGRKWRYPAAGELRTSGEGTCSQSYTP